jgi:RNA-directed DNA polymerase
MSEIIEILNASLSDRIALHQNYRNCLSRPLFAFAKFPNHEKNAGFFLSISTPHQLCHFFKRPLSEFQEIINNPKYSDLVIKKKRGRKRQIHVPSNELKAIQKRLNFFLQAYYLCIKPEEVFGFVINPDYQEKQCNIKENALPHVGQKHLLNLDLKDFFSSISASAVKALFKSNYFKFEDQLATALTLLTTYEGKLPTGTPTSPVISNFICLKMDEALKSFSETHRINFTRYADDLSFSSNQPFSQDLIDRLIELISSHGFEVNPKKLRLKSSFRKQMVTGLTVNTKVNVDRKILKKVRAMAHDLSVNGIEHAASKHFNLSVPADTKAQEKFMNKLSGYVNFIGQIRGKDDKTYMKIKTDMGLDLGGAKRG